MRFWYGADGGTRMRTTDWRCGVGGGDWGERQTDRVLLVEGVRGV